METFLLSHIGFIVAKKADALIVVTRGIKEYLIEHGIDKYKISVVSNGVNINLFKPVDNISSLDVLKGQYNISSKSDLVAYIGSMTPWQGVEYLISAASLVLKECPDTQFIIVGDKGPMLNQWRDLVKSNGLSDSFTFTGSVPYDKVPLHINIADICVVPKRELKSGYSPLKLYEYMACAKPIIATNTAGFEILEHYNSGILVNPKNSQEFANAIIKLLKNKQLRKEMGERGRKLVVEHYSWDTSIRKIISVFEGIKST
jgi:glycosyltransferase involved in cell wall biosynthesis